ncbi:hypothetical protein BN1200_370069 [Klebsiella variicola]|nr:hypothetical protein BN1200_370069 [Klebsiella variicola]
MIRSDQGLSFYGVVLEGGCRLEIDQHEPQILRAGDFILIPAAYRFALTSLTPPPSPALETIPMQLAGGRLSAGSPRQACADADADWPLRFRFNERQPAGLAVASLCGGPQSTAAGHLCRAAERGSAGGSRGQIFRSGADG